MTLIFYNNMILGHKTVQNNMKEIVKITLFLFFVFDLICYIYTSI